MDWVALHASAFWKELWEDPEIKKLSEDRVRTLIRARLDNDTRSRIGGQLEMLEYLPNYVREMANKQAEQEKQHQQQGAVSLQSRMRRLVPRIF